METSLMVNDYPENNIKDVKKYKFKCYCEVEIIVSADSLKEAKENCTIHDCDDYEIKCVEDIVDYEILKD